MIRRLLYSWIVNVAAIWVASVFVDGINYSEDYWILIVTGLVFGLVNFFVKPVAKLLALPLIVITLGLILFFINLLMLYITSWIVTGFEIDSFMSGSVGDPDHHHRQLGADQRLRRRRAAAPIAPSSPKQRLLRWHADNGRDLPWRHTRDPYAVLVSEVMLQQTQVARVVPRWTAWLERWPTVEALAASAALRGHPRLGRPGLQPSRRESPPRGHPHL